MKILNWEKQPEFTDADRLLIQKAIDGRLPASVKEHFITGDFHQKYDQQTGDKIPKQKHELLKPDKTARHNWGDLRRALIRGTRTGDIISFRLMKTGELSVNWFVKFSKPKAKPVKVESKPTKSIQSRISQEEHEKDTRLPAVKFLSIRRKRRFVPYDTAKPRFIVEYEKRKDHEYLHSIKAQEERARAWHTVDDPEYCMHWPLKFKTRWHIYTNPVHFARTSEHVLEANRKSRTDLDG